MTRITSAIAAAFIASASFATAALADEGDYYEGAQPTQQAQSVHGARVDSFGYTGSIARANGSAQSNQSFDGTVTLTVATITTAQFVRTNRLLFKIPNICPQAGSQTHRRGQL
ncbi:hypothetical protein LZK73_07555 [Neorhizobium galegae]|nr:hypothetical protein LZK73_07555 [Neorhizobium galegae]